MEQACADRQSCSLTREGQGPCPGKTVDIKVTPDNKSLLCLTNLTSNVLTEARPETRQVGQIGKPVGVSSRLAEAAPIKGKPVRHFGREALPEKIKPRKGIDQFLHQSFLFRDPIGPFRI